MVLGTFIHSLRTNKLRGAGVRGQFQTATYIEPVSWKLIYDIVLNQKPLNFLTWSSLKNNILNIISLGVLLKERGNFRIGPKPQRFYKSPSIVFYTAVYVFLTSFSVIVCVIHLQIKFYMCKVNDKGIRIVI